MTGKGCYVYSEEGKQYEGDFVEGFPYGLGELKCQLFNYKGQFKSGLFEGKGCLQDYNNNAKFIGEYFDGKKKGKGLSVDMFKREIYEGFFKDDMKDGFGVQAFLNSKMLLKGIWAKDLLVKKITEEVLCAEILSQYES